MGPNSKVNSNPGAVGCLWCLAVREGNHGYTPDTRKWVLGDEVVPKAKGSPGLGLVLTNGYLANWLPPRIRFLTFSPWQWDRDIAVSLFRALFPKVPNKDNCAYYISRWAIGTSADCPGCSLRFSVLTVGRCRPCWLELHKLTGFSMD